MAFRAAGHRPGEGPYGRNIDAAINRVLSYRQTNGLLSYRMPALRPNPNLTSSVALYNHAIAGLMLTEVYGMTDKPQAAKIRYTVEQALAFICARQKQPKQHAANRGGWRYYLPYSRCDSDLSVTAWQLMFLRSAKNAGFRVPTESVRQALLYVQRCFDPRRDRFGGPQAVSSLAS